MALRLRRDVQKASYYVWFLGAEEAKGLRGSRVINSVLPYLIDRARSQEPLKVTLQVSHKGIKILQGSSKHFIPHSAITSSVQTDDIVACVLLLYNPATKCPLHVHAYRCDSESTAEALHQQLQVLINRAENQKRFEELESRLGILPPLSTGSGGSGSGANNNNSKSSATTSHSKSSDGHGPKSYQSTQLQAPRRHESSPKRFSSSLGSDTGNSTRESECSEEHGGSPVSRSPPMMKPLPPLQPSNELFDSLAAELRAKLNGNGPPLLLPPRDYDTVHRSKGNLTAIELRRCRNSLIVGSTTPTGGVSPGAGVAKQVSSRGSSGIGSDLAPSPERQELNSSSDDEHWSNEADNSVIALKPSQIPIERPAPLAAHHPQLNRKSAVPPPEDGYLRDLPAKPYTPHGHSAAVGGARRPNAHSGVASNGHLKATATPSTSSGDRYERDQRSKTPASSSSWTREDEIKPIIVRPADYDAKFSRVLQAEQKQEYRGREREHAKLQDTDKYNEINRLLNKKLSLDRDSPDRAHYKHNSKQPEELDDFDDSDPSSDHVPHVHGHAHAHAHAPSAFFHKDNLTDKQKFIEYSAKKQSKAYGAGPGPAAGGVVDESQRYGGRHRYVDPADLPFEQPTHKKYAALHRGAPSPERSDLGARTAERHRERDRQRSGAAADEAPREREREREHFSRSSERNPYREPESIPYIQSMEKMMKSSAMRYKSYDGAAEQPTPPQPQPKEEAHTKVSQRSKSYTKHEDDRERDRDSYNNYSGNGRSRSDYAPSAASSNVTPKDRFKDAKDKFRAMERTGSRHDLADEKDAADYKPRRRGSIDAVDTARVYEDWSDEERLDESPPPPVMARSRSRSRDHWEQSAPVPLPIRDRDMLAPREHLGRERNTRDFGRDMRPREMSGMRSDGRDVRDARDMRDAREPRDIRDAREPRDMRDAREPRDPYRENRYDLRDMPPPRPAHEREPSRDFGRERTRDQSRDYMRRADYSPEPRPGPDYGDRSMEKQRVPHPSDMYPPPPVNGGSGSKALSNLPKGYRHSYAEPVFARTGGRVGLAAVNPF